MSECSKPQNMPCRSRKKFSWPTISIKLFAFITSRVTRGKPSGSSFFADKNDDTGVMFRVGELATEEKYRSFCGDASMGGIDDAEVLRVGVVTKAVVGRDRFCEAVLSRARTLSASAIMRFAIPSNTWRIFTMAFVALRTSRPAMAINA